MHEVARRFVERMGLHMEADGLPRSAGRMIGHLLLAESACSLDEIAESLQVSKASVSTNARMLEQVGILERTCEPGDRRDFYCMRPDAWERMLLTARRRWEEARVLLAETASAIPDEMRTGRQRLEEAERFHSLLIEELDTLVERWRAAPAHERGSLGALRAGEDVAAD